MADAYDRTPRLGFPMMQEGGQKNAHVIYNETLLMLEALINPFVLDIANSPASSTNGNVYIVGSTPTGAFADFASNSLVVAWNGGWVEIAATEGMWVWLDDVSAYYLFNGTAWVAGFS